MFFVTSCSKKTTNNTVVQDSIYYSIWTPLSMTLGTDSFYTEDFSNKAITAGIISHGAVLGYFGYPSGSGDTLMVNEAELTTYYGVEMLVTVGALEVSAPYPSDMTYTGSQGFLFRYVIIPGNVLSNTSLKGLTQQQLNKMNFTDVQKALQAGQSASGNRVSLP